MRIFRPSDFKWQCDSCGLFFTAGKGGVCRSCKRVLCGAHLYGSVFNRLKSAFSGREVTCPECRQKSAGS